jgi:cytochrome c oxidase subunit I+III
VRQGRHFLPGTVTGLRETIVTSPVEARPQYVAIIPGPGWAHVIAAVCTAGFFLSLTVQLVWLAAAFGVVAIGAVLWWLWTGTDLGPVIEKADIGGGLRLPVYFTGPDSVGWWAMVVLILVDATTFGCLIFTHAFLWLSQSQPDWPPQGMVLPDLLRPGVAALLIAGSAALVWLSDLVLRRGRSGLMAGLVLAALVLFVAGAALDLGALWDAGLRPTVHAFAASVFANQFWQGFHAALLLAMALYLAARAFAGMVGPVRRVTFDNVRIFWFYAAAQALAGMALTHLFPRLAGTG